MIAGEVDLDWFAVYSISEAQWILKWEDEFDLPGLDTAMWSVESDCDGGGNGEQQCYTAKNVRLREGMLELLAIREQYAGNTSGRYEPDGIGKPVVRQYTSGRLHSVQASLRGRITVNAKIPSGHGLWPAIWMLPATDSYGGWAASGEIDIMEASA